MKFNDFFKPRWKHSDPKIRNEAIKELTEEYNLNDLKDIVLTDAKPENQKLALKKITDEMALTDISNQSGQKAIIDSSIKRLNEIWQKQVVKEKDEKKSLELLSRITDQKILEDLVLTHKSISIRNQCAGQIVNGNTFYKIALNEKEESLALKAFERVTKPVQFETLAKKANCKAVRSQSRAKLDSIQKPATTGSKDKIDIAKLELICSSFESLAGSKDFSSAEELSGEYTRTWESIFSHELGDTLSLEKRYHIAKKKVEDKIEKFQKAEQEKARQDKESSENLRKRTELCIELEKAGNLKITGDKERELKKITDQWNKIQLVGTEEESLIVKNYNRIFSEINSDLKKQTQNLSKDDSLESLLDQFKALVKKEPGPENIQTLSELQASWEKLNVDENLPAYQEYQGLVQTAEEKIHEWKNIKDESQKEDLKKMKNILLKLDELNDKSDILSAEKDFRQLVQNWNALDNFSMLAEDLQEEYRTLTEDFNKSRDSFNEAQEWLRWANLNKKQEIYGKLKEVFENHSDEKELFNKMRGYQSEWKSIGPVSWDKSKEIWDNYQKLVDDIYEKCQGYFEELVTERKSNLVEKEKICAQVEGYIAENKIKEFADAVKEIQAEWKNIGPVPRENSEEIWTRFKNACDKFFLMRKEQFHVIDKDREENLVKKLELIELVESLKESTEWKKTGDLLKKAQADWKEIGPVPKEKVDIIWEKFREPCDHFFNARDVYFKNLDEEKSGNLEKKEGLIQKLADLEKMEDDNEKYNFIKQLQAEWKAIGPVDKSKMNEIWERFRKPIDEFFDERKEKYAQEQDAREENYLKKEELCKQAEKISDSNQWKTTSEELKNLQTEWKQIGPAPREKDKEVWDRFRAACDGFFNRMKDYYKQMDDQREINLRIKEDLCFQAEDLAGFIHSGEEYVELDKRNWAESSERIKSFQKKWKQTGPVPKNKSDELWNKFRMACDYVFDVARVANQEGAFNFEANLAAKKELCENAEIISNQVHTDAQINKIRDLQRDWKQIGPVPKEDYIELWARFREASDLVYREDERLKV